MQSNTTTANSLLPDRATFERRPRKILVPACGQRIGMMTRATTSQIDTGAAHMPSSVAHSPDPRLSARRRDLFGIEFRIDRSTFPSEYSDYLSNHGQLNDITKAERFSPDRVESVRQLMPL